MRLVKKVRHTELCRIIASSYSGLMVAWNWKQTKGLVQATEVKRISGFTREAELTIYKIILYVGCNTWNLTVGTWLCLTSVLCKCIALFCNRMEKWFPFLSLSSRMLFLANLANGRLMYSCLPLLVASLMDYFSCFLCMNLKPRILPCVWF